jgi:hypothetical protein
MATQTSWTSRLEFSMNQYNAAVEVVFKGDGTKIVGDMRFSFDAEDFNKAVDKAGSLVGKVFPDFRIIGLARNDIQVPHTLRSSRKGLALPHRRPTPMARSAGTKLRQPNDQTSEPTIPRYMLDEAEYIRMYGWSG